MVAEAVAAEKAAARRRAAEKKAAAEEKKAAAEKAAAEKKREEQIRSMIKQCVLAAIDNMEVIKNARANDTAKRVAAEERERIEAAELARIRKESEDAYAAKMAIVYAANKRVADKCSALAEREKRRRDSASVERSKERADRLKADRLKQEQMVKDEKRKVDERKHKAFLAERDAIKAAAAKEKVLRDEAAEREAAQEAARRLALGGLVGGHNVSRTEDDVRSVAASHAVSLAPTDGPEPQMTRHAEQRKLERFHVTDAQFKALVRECLRKPDRKYATYDRKDGSLATAYQKGGLKLICSREGDVIKTVIWKSSVLNRGERHWHTSTSSKAGPSSSTSSKAGPSPSNVWSMIDSVTKLSIAEAEQRELAERAELAEAIRLSIEEQ